MTIQNATALVTGAAQGMGRAIVSALLDAGASRVLAVDVQQAQFDDDRVVSVVADVTDEDAIAAIFDQEDRPVQVVVNCAGVYRSRDGLEIPLDQWALSLAVNLTAPFVIMKHASKRLITEGLEGAFVNLASVAGKRGFPNQADYCAAKAGLIGLTRATALDLSPRGITVNAIAPGTVRTPMIDSVVRDLRAVSGLSDEEQRAEMVKDIPIRRMQEPEEIAAAVVFLVSAPGRAVSGETLVVDGGLTRD
jgi:NAD(P)-dependent dehydrogenase (short-subunit alcohol dehydrogenase family)